MNRVQRILVGVLAVQILGVFLLQGPLRSSTSAPELHVLFPGLAELQPSRLEIVGPEDGGSVTLTREGEYWGIQEAGGYPADQGKIDKLLESLTTLEVRRPVVTSSRYHKALKVADGEHERHVSLFSGDDPEPALELYIGSSPNYRTTHIRRADEAEVYEVRGLGAYDVRDTASGWILSKILDLQADQVTAFRVENGQGSFGLERLADGGWQATSDRQRVLDKAEVDSLVRAAVSLTAAEPAGLIDRAAQGLDSPAATVFLTITRPPADSAEGEEPQQPEVQDITVWVGGLTGDDDTQRYVAHSEFEFAARTWKGALDGLVDATLASLEPGAEDS